MHFMAFLLKLRLFVLTSKFLNILINNWIRKKKLRLLISANNNECIQRNNGIYLGTFSSTCNGKTTCRILPTRLNLADCGGQAASYLHIEYICATSKRFKWLVLKLNFNQF